MSGEMITCDTMATFDMSEFLHLLRYVRLGEPEHVLFDLPERHLLEARGIGMQRVSHRQSL